MNTGVLEYGVHRMVTFSKERILAFNPAGDLDLPRVGKRLPRLKLIDVDLESRTAFIFDGKGKKDRMIPIGERAVLWLRKYLAESRPRLARKEDEGFVFLTNVGEFLSFVPAYHGDADAGRGRGRALCAGDARA